MIRGKAEPVIGNVQKGWDSRKINEFEQICRARGNKRIGLEPSVSEDTDGNG